MPTVVTHILIPLILTAIFRDFILSKKHHKSFPLWYVLIAGLAGALPDVDIAVTWIAAAFGNPTLMWHRLLTHSFLFPLFFLLLGLLTLKVRSKEFGKHHLKLSTVFFLIAFGTATHIALDATIHGVVSLYYPFSNALVGLNLVGLLPYPLNNLAIPSVEGIMLIFWLVYLELKHRISDFI
jgi:membrane-bound metal-dependent hydrolase YbcI (DUF457 family)